MALISPYQLPRQLFEVKQQHGPEAGLPDGLLSNQKMRILVHFGMEN
jgi:hypothetical protein